MFQSRIFVVMVLMLVSPALFGSRATPLCGAMWLTPVPSRRRFSLVGVFDHIESP